MRYEVIKLGQDFHELVESNVENTIYEIFAVRVSCHVFAVHEIIPEVLRDELLQCLPNRPIASATSDQTSKSMSRCLEHACDLTGEAFRTACQEANQTYFWSLAPILAIRGPLKSHVIVHDLKNTSASEVVALSDAAYAHWAGCLLSLQFGQDPETACAKVLDGTGIVLLDAHDGYGHVWASLEISRIEV